MSTFQWDAASLQACMTDPNAMLAAFQQANRGAPRYDLSPLTPVVGVNANVPSAFPPRPNLTAAPVGDPLSTLLPTRQTVPAPSPDRTR